MCQKRKPDRRGGCPPFFGSAVLFSLAAVLLSKSLNFRSWKDGIDPWVSKKNSIDLLVLTKDTSLVRDRGNATNHVNKKVRTPRYNNIPCLNTVPPFPNFGCVLKQLCIVHSYDFLAGLRGSYLLIIQRFGKETDSDSLIYE
ncbi:hypothetical protein ACE6ED_26375, partial [Paenibacillus sp. CN-4]|uniref:hypothetical protein n=1 Tax=Paenibacillus nanchangensis TaxID=3348343 RepID=UPI00397BA555